MSNILVIDTKLMMYKQFHSHRPPLGFLEAVSNLALELLPPINKVVFVKDYGKSKRAALYPAYKEKRLEVIKNKTPAESRRLHKFLELYEGCDDLLKQFGSVIAVFGIEADDLASMITQRLSINNNIYLLSADSDWSRFLVNPNTYMVLPKKKLLDRSEAEQEFGVAPEDKLFIDCITGVDKENVDGIKMLGTKRAVTLFNKVDKNKNKFFVLLDEYIEQKKYGMVLPEWASEARDVYLRNYAIFEAHSFDSLSQKEQEVFLSGWRGVPERNTESILKISSIYLEEVYVPPARVVKFFHLT